MGKLEDKYRDRKFMLLLYPEDATHVRALDVIKGSYDCAYILHDKDLDETGNLKKPHWHVVINTGKNAIWNTSLADTLGLALNYIEQARNMDRALQYLIHYNEADKHQYEIDEVYGSLKNRLKMTMNAGERLEGEKVEELINFIENYDGHLTITMFSKHCASVGMWDVYRRSGSILNRIIDEHNYQEQLKREKKRELEQSQRENDFTSEFVDSDGFKKNVDVNTGELKDTPFTQQSLDQGWN